MTTVPDIAAIRERALRATPGDWTDYRMEVHGRTYRVEEIRPVDPDELLLLKGSGGAQSWTTTIAQFKDTETDEENSAFILAVQPRAALALCDEVERLRAENEALTAAVTAAEARFREYGDLHAAKPLPDMVKAQRNYAMADQMLAALAPQPVAQPVVRVAVATGSIAYTPELVSPWTHAGYSTEEWTPPIYPAEDIQKAAEWWNALDGQERALLWHRSSMGDAR